MTARLVTAALIDVTAAAKKVFSLEGEARRAAVRETLGARWSASLEDWFVSADAESFMAAVRGAYLYATDGIWPDDDGLLVALGRHVSGDLTDIIDGLLGAGFFRADRPTREAALAKESAFSGHAALTDAARRMLVVSTYHDIAEGLRPFLARCGLSGRVVVRTAAPLGIDRVREVRAELRRRHPAGYAAFYVDRGLGGGMRVFADGKMADASWAAEIDRVFSTAQMN